tara:strand:- start:28432 stop:30180 length:1749 start_codon:yes stop_codon:yes gene_type:complete
MTRIAIVDNQKLKDLQKKKHIQSLCPVNRTGTECIKIEEDNTLTIDEKLCTGCGICPKAAPDAIKIINLPEQLDQTPIHRYGENKFVLYSLPAPIDNNVVGILGVNGIGKSTAIQILAGIQKPNFGDWGKKDTSYKELIDFFKGSETQNFFEKQKQGKTKISYKPQQVELIPKTTKGKVLSLLKKVDEKNQLDEIVEKLQLKEILDNDISKISGGELQRVAIAASILKDANIFIMDEPTSFLDIKQRIKMSNFTKSLTEKKNSIVVVEHDLIILDYIADLVHVMFGQEASYGIVSGVKPIKRGINVYLSGYLKEENIRFRTEIKFNERPPSKKASKEILVEWENIETKLGKFSLKAEKGTIHKKEVIGILGENGIGKTTFVKILASVIKQKKGSISKKIKVSYKPQYIESSTDLVSQALATAFKKYKTQIITPLHLEPLALKKINELSGGELQRVAIANCLQKEADLYLLDEPSAYLDSEQRLVVSKILKEFMEQKGTSALVVDHDLLFIDYVSDKLIVFDGTPAIEGSVKGPFTMEEGMNIFLKDLGITLRRDKESKRPRVNKINSKLDREQKQKEMYYYT